MEAIAERVKQRRDIWPLKYSVEATPQHYETASGKAAVFSRYVRHIVRLRHRYYLARLYAGDLVVVQGHENGNDDTPRQLFIPLSWDSYAELTATFEALAARWEQETGLLSTLIDKVTHPAYQRIIGLGPTVIPLVLQRLKRRPGYWFWALEALTGIDPAEKAGDFNDAVAAWLDWGRAQHYLNA